MRTLHRPSEFLFLLGIAFLLLARCSEDNAPMTSNPDIVGTWTASDWDIDASVGGVSAIDYLVDVVGMSPTQAAFAYAYWEGEIKSELVGSITFNADHTYSSTFGGSPDSGTWDLSSDLTTLTLDSGTPDEQVLDVTDLTGSTLTVVLNQDIPVDLDSDPNTPDILVNTIATISMTK